MMPSGQIMVTNSYTIQPIPETQMMLNKEQFNKLVENYASHIIEGLDSDSLELMVFDLLVDSYNNYTDEEILNEIEELYGEEVATEFYNDVTVVEVAQ